MKSNLAILDPQSVMQTQEKQLTPTKEMPMTLGKLIIDWDERRAGEPFCWPDKQQRQELQLGQLHLQKIEYNGFPMTNIQLTFTNGVTSDISTVNVNSTCFNYRYIAVKNIKINSFKITKKSRKLDEIYDIGINKDFENFDSNGKDYGYQLSRVLVPEGHRIIGLYGKRR